MPTLQNLLDTNNNYQLQGVAFYAASAEQYTDCFDEEGNPAYKLNTIYRYYRESDHDHYYTYTSNEIGTATPG